MYGYDKEDDRVGASLNASESVGKKLRMASEVLEGVIDGECPIDKSWGSGPTLGESIMTDIEGAIDIAYNIYWNVGKMMIARIDSFPNDRRQWTDMHYAYIGDAEKAIRSMAWLCEHAADPDDDDDSPLMAIKHIKSLLRKPIGEWRDEQ